MSIVKDMLSYMMVLPDEPGIKELRSEAHIVTKKVYTIMIWLRCTRNTSADTSVPRFKAFPA